MSVETPALGTITVNPDCSFTSTLEVPEFFPGAIVLKGVFFLFFYEGKDMFREPEHSRLPEGDADESQG